MILFNEFVIRSTVQKSILNNDDAAKTFEYLKNPRVIANIIFFSEVRLPGISGIVTEIEDFCDETQFSMEDPENRKSLGKMIRYVMDYYGFSPLEVPRNENRLRNFSRARYIKSGAIYYKTHNPRLRIDFVIKTERGEQIE